MIANVKQGVSGENLIFKLDIDKLSNMKCNVNKKLTKWQDF